MKRFSILILSVFAVFLVACGAGGYNSDEACAWCGETPTKSYKSSTGYISYVCKECSETCLWCGKKATTHYSNGFGVETFVCKECFDELSDLK